MHDRSIQTDLLNEKSAAAEESTTIEGRNYSSYSQSTVIPLIKNIKKKLGLKRALYKSFDAGDVRDSTELSQVSFPVTERCSITTRFGKAMIPKPLRSDRVIKPKNLSFERSSKSKLIVVPPPKIDNLIVNIGFSIPKSPRGEGKHKSTEDKDRIKNAILKLKDKSLIFNTRKLSQSKKEWKKGSERSQSHLT